MTSPTPLPGQDDLVARVTRDLCTRTLNQFAQEARLDGESLQQALERYEIDYAWHILGSQRLCEATWAQLEARLQQAPSEAQKARVREVLAAAAAAQPTELLMSYDCELPEQLAGWMVLA